MRRRWWRGVLSGVAVNLGRGVLASRPPTLEEQLAVAEPRTSPGVASGDLSETGGGINECNAVSAEVQVLSWRSAECGQREAAQVQCCGVSAVRTQAVWEVRSAELLQQGVSESRLEEPQEWQVGPELHQAKSTNLKRSPGERPNPSELSERAGSGLILLKLRRNWPSLRDEPLRNNG